MEELNTDSKFLRLLADYLVQNLSSGPTFHRSSMVMMAPGHELSAKVTCHDRLGDICIYSLQIKDGLFKYNHMILQIALSNNIYFPGIGLSDLRMDVPPDYNNFQYLQEDIIALGYPEKILDGERKKLLNFLNDLSVKLIVLHESIHINHGHLDYIFAASGETEFIEGELNGLSTLDRQTLEMDADVVSFQILFAKMVAKITKAPDEIPIQLRSKEGILYSLLFVLELSHFSRSSRKIGKISDLEKFPHLNPVLRMQYIRAMMRDIFTKENDYSMLEYLERQQTIIIQDLIMGQLIDKEYVFSLLKLQTDEGNTFYLKILKNWGSLIPKLSPYSSFKLPEV